MTKNNKIKVTDLEGRGQMLRLLEQEYNTSVIMELRTTYTGQLYADYYLTRNDIFENKKIGVFNQLQPQKSWYYASNSSRSTFVKPK